LGEPPKTEDEWPDKPWEIKKVNGKEILYVVLSEITGLKTGKFYTL